VGIEALETERLLEHIVRLLEQILERLPEPALYFPVTQITVIPG
jgi:hypothetical protein